VTANPKPGAAGGSAASRKYEQSQLWAHINESQATTASVPDLAGFKSSEVNYRLALWDPRTNGVRYLKELIYHLAASMTEENWTRMRRIRNREVGDPIAIRYHGEQICMDYLQAVFELEYITAHVGLDDLRILEIGAGYGRTCHAMMSNHAVAAYYIVDLDNSLALAREYLRRVLTEEMFSKVHFMTVHGLDDSLKSMRFGLCINIDSFAEMTADTVANYLALIDDRCDFFYVNNPVGKYMDKSLDDHRHGDEVVQWALRAGPLRQVIDIHNSQAVEAQADKFIAAYRPADQWECVASGHAVPWSYYWQALYRSRPRVDATPDGTEGT
jgi:putative sugar O-methyltransferase